MNKNKNTHFAFQITRKIIFEVELKAYGFTTQAGEFNQPKTDWISYGQAQKRLLPQGVAADFFYKFDKYHLKNLSDEQLKEVYTDIETLKSTYNFLESENKIRFWQLKDLSMMKLKRTQTEK